MKKVIQLLAVFLSLCALLAFMLAWGHNLKKTAVKEPATRVERPATNVVNLSEFARGRLSKDSVIRVYSLAERKDLSYYGKGKTHCQLHCGIDARSSSLTGITIKVINPVEQDNIINASHTTVKIFCSLDDRIDLSGATEDVALRLTDNTYDALIAVVNFYAGTSEHDSYLGDPLDGKTSSLHVFTEK